MAEHNDLSAQTQALYIFASIALTLFAGLMSGLTLGMMSQDHLELEVLRRSGTAKEKKYARLIAPALKRPHYLLVTLLLCNAAAMEALPLVLDQLVSPVVAIVLAVTAVLIFGEILPQAVCSRFGLAIGAYCSWFVRLLMLLVGVISFPISKLLDWMLGTEQGALWRRPQLKALVDIHAHADPGGRGYLGPDELAVIHGALDLTGKQAALGMTPLDKVFMLPIDANLDVETLKEALASGHSRVPVHRPGNRRDVLGLILVKELVLIDLDAGSKVRDLRIRPLPRLRSDTAMYDLLRLFRTGRSHMVLLTRPPPGGPFVDPSQGVPQGGGAKGSLDVEDSAFDGATPGAAEKVAGGVPCTKRGGEVVVDIAALQEADDAGGNTPSTNGPPELQPLKEGDQGSPEGGEPEGIVTLEDVLEELINQEIVDESDVYVDNMASQRVNTASLVRDLPPHLQHSLSHFLGPHISARGPLPRASESGGSGAGAGAGATAAAVTAAAVAATAAATARPAAAKGRPSFDRGSDGGAGTGGGNSGGGGFHTPLGGTPRGGSNRPSPRKDGSQREGRRGEGASGSAPPSPSRPPPHEQQQQQEHQQQQQQHPQPQRAPSALLAPRLDPKGLVRLAQGDAGAPQGLVLLPPSPGRQALYQKGALPPPIVARPVKRSRSMVVGPGSSIDASPGRSPRDAYAEALFGGTLSEGGGRQSPALGSGGAFSGGGSGRQSPALGSGGAFSGGGSGRQSPALGSGGAFPGGGSDRQSPAPGAAIPPPAGAPSGAVPPGGPQGASSGIAGSPPGRRLPVLLSRGAAASRTQPLPLLVPSSHASYLPVPQHPSPRPGSAAVEGDGSTSTGPGFPESKESTREAG